MKKYIILFLLVAIPVISFSQKKKNLREHNIKSKTTYSVDYEDSNGKETIESVEIYDERGNLIEKKDYDDGKLDKHRKYEYNKDDDITKEIRINTSGKIYKTIEYKYNEEGFKVEKIVKNSKSIITSKEKYVYQKR